MSLFGIDRAQSRKLNKGRGNIVWVNNFKQRGAREEVFSRYPIKSSLEFLFRRDRASRFLRGICDAKAS